MVEGRVGGRGENLLHHYNHPLRRNRELCFSDKNQIVILFQWLQKSNGSSLKDCLHGGGGPQVGEVTRLGGVTRLSI